MSTEEQRKSPIATVGIIAIFLTTFVYMADIVYYPAFMGTMEAFPDASMEMLNFCMTGSQLTATLASFLVMPLMAKVSKKRLLLVCTAVFGACELLAPMGGSILMLTVMRTVAGIGFGGVLAVATALIQQLFADDPERRDRLVGIYNGCLSLVAAVGSVVGGILATRSWDAVFSWYWIAVPIFVLIAVFVPETPVDDQQDMGAEGEGQDAGWGDSLKSVLAASVAYMFVNATYMAAASGQTAIYLAELGLGDEAVAGTLAGVACVIGFFAGLGFGPLYGRLGRSFAPVMYVVLSCGLALYAFGGSVVVLALGLSMISFAYAAGLSYYMVFSADVVPPAKAYVAISIVSVAVGLGSFVSPFMVTALQQVMGTTSLVPVYKALLAVAVAGLVASAILAGRARRSRAQD